jgi:3-phosphoshikimate 1-carboxyvinyltransferase
VESDLRLDGLAADAQGDRAVVPLLRAMGAEFRVGRDSVRVQGPFHLRGRSMDLRDNPDLVPPLAVAGGFASGTTVLRNIGHLRLKESDRLGGLAAKLRALGIRARAAADSLEIEGSRSRPRGAALSAGGDHRVAMALAVAGLRAGPVTVRGFEAVSKSYPGFAAHLRALGVRASWSS